MEFNTPQSRRTYSDRSVDEQWKAWCQQTLAPQNKAVVEIGCGGGIYSRGFASLEAKSVIGIDGSSQYVDEAQLATVGNENVSFKLGDAADSGLPDACADIVYQRALIHHLDESNQAANAREVLRLLKPNGVCAVQDRTVEDVQSEHPDYWIRSTLFETFPRLIEFEQSRRPSSNRYTDCLIAGGFQSVRVLTYSEVRKEYSCFADLESEILARKGKSILFQLTDEELKQYCRQLRAKATEGPLREIDRWTIWLAKKEKTEEDL